MWAAYPAYPLVATKNVGATRTGITTLKQHFIPTIIRTFERRQSLHVTLQTYRLLLELSIKELNVQEMATSPCKSEKNGEQYIIGEGVCFNEEFCTDLLHCGVPNPWKGK